MSRGSARVKRWRDRHPDRQRDANAVCNARRGGYLPPKTKEANGPARPVDGKCELCGNEPGRRGLFRDHCHGTGIVRGWLCQRCNTGLAMIDEVGLERIISFLTGGNASGDNAKC